MEHAQEKSAGSLISLIVPPIACSFPWRNHPDVLELKRVADAWVVEQCKKLPGACKGERTPFFFSPAFLVDSAMHLLATLYYPNAVSARVLQPIVKLMCWYFMLDNFIDDPREMGADCIHADRLIDSIVAVFEPSTHLGNLDVEQHKTIRAAAAPPSQQPLPSDDDQQLVRQLLADSARDWWQEMQLTMTPSLQARFSTIFIDYLISNRWQVGFCTRLQPPDLDTYFHIRTKSIGWYPLQLLIESCLGIELDEEALTHPLFMKLQQNVCEYVLLVNDITSFSKEYKDAQIFNTVFLVCFKELSLTELPAKNWQALMSEEVLQEGVEKVSKMIKERDRECVRIMEEIRNSLPLMGKRGMDSYLESLGYHVAGTVYWHLFSGRYAVPTPHLQNGHLDLLSPIYVHLCRPELAHLSCSY